jgi:hypothetical protein
MILTAAILTAGIVLALFGAAGHRIVAAHPDPDSLSAARAIATAGRRLTTTVVALCTLHPTGLPHQGLWLTAAALAAAATLNTRRPPGRHRSPARGMTKLPRAAAAAGVNR